MVMSQLIPLRMVSLFALLGAGAFAADTRLEGQVVCCEDCWNQADRSKVAFGTTADLAKSAGCVANGDPTLLAVRENGKFVMYQLEPGRFRLTGPNWLEYVGDQVAASGTVRQQKDKLFLRVNDFQVLARSAAFEEGKKVLGSAPALRLVDLSGVEQSLATRRGRLVVLNFWGTFCLPCAKEMPDLSAIQTDYAAMGVEVIGAAADPAEERPKVLSFVKKYRINFPIWLAASAEDMRRFGLGEALPATVILNREGQVVWQKRGVTTRAELAKQIDALLTKPVAGAAVPASSPAAKAKPAIASRVPS